MSTTAFPHSPVDLDAPVPLHKLTYLDEVDQVTVGRTDIDSYCVLPTDGAALLRQLEAGRSLREAGRWYESKYGETVDTAEFLAAITELELVRRPDDGPIDEAPVRWQRFGNAVFSLPVFVGCAIVVAISVFMVLDDRSLAPRYQNLFFTDSMVILELTIFFGQVPLMLCHEAAHALAGRRLGLRSRLSVGRRLYFIVFETSLDGLVTVPRRQRYLPMLAGMLVDVVAIAALTIAAAMLHQPGEPMPLAAGLCLALAFATVLRLAWQFYFYLETDIYHVIVTVLGCNNLQTVSRRLLANRFWRIVGRPAKVRDETLWHARDRQVANWYSWLVVVGYTLSFVMLLTWGIPTMIGMFSIAFARYSDASASALGWADSTIFLLFNLGQIVMLVALALRDRRRRGPTSQLVLS